MAGNRTRHWSRRPTTKVDRTQPTVTTAVRRTAHAAEQPHQHTIPEPSDQRANRQHRGSRGERRTGFDKRFTRAPEELVHGGPSASAIAFTFNPLQRSTTWSLR
ncbi:hypothetical protein [Streptomyces noursei]|uniref:hypothetical protein n=1 Tax=Streptomyces noursei TaxID=1971 RepID=UPI001675648C|nr:hypothetical protein [Streptomyces noursei]MCZ1013623.1 hypothetical protein [Streptomyces noursei]GGX25348.1 hypothetical protein GCM10010341_53240 [Streptomyces noursei]